LRKLGLRAAIVYHEVDAATPAVALADVAFKISGRTPVSAYLDAEQIVTAARTVGAGALHPGYGFLSENAGFCARGCRGRHRLHRPIARGDRTDGRQDPRAQFCRRQWLSGRSLRHRGE